MLDELEDDDRPYHPLDDGRWAHLPSLLDGRVFTHRLTEAEAEHDVLEVEPDLTLTQALAEFPGQGRLTNGGDLGSAYPGVPRRGGAREIPDSALAELGSLILPAGTLAGLDRRAGDLVGVRHGTDGIEILAIDDAGSLPAAVRSHVLGILDEDEPTESIDLLSLVLADAPDAFAVPTRPVNETLRDLGASYHDGLIARPGFDWEGWRPRLQANRLAERYGLPDDEARAAATLLAYVRSTTFALDEVDQRIRATGLEVRKIEGQQVDDLLDDMAATLRLPLPDPEDVARGLAHLVEPPVAYVVADESFGSDLVRSGTGLAVAAESLLALAARPARGALHWLSARGLEWSGDLAAAEDQLRTADRLDPEFYPAALDLARLANDRGDVTTGLALLARVPEEVSPFLRSVLEEQRPQPTRMMPRNDPCWCGSGRKFKACHLRQPQTASSADRTRWLYAKGIVYALESAWAPLVEILTDIRTADITSEELAHEVANDGLVLDVAMFEGGVFAEYLETRGHLLPADELLLAQQWLLTERSAYEVIEVEPGVSVTFRDLRTGDVIDAADSVASQTLRPGHLVCCHLLPQPDGDHAIYSIDPIRLHERSALLELLDEDEVDPERLVAFLSRHLAPPALVNTEGHPLILCDVQLTSTDPAALSAALDARFGPAEVADDESTWIDQLEVEGTETIRATLTLAADDPHPLDEQHRASRPRPRRSAGAPARSHRRVAVRNRSARAGPRLEHAAGTPAIRPTVSPDRSAPSANRSPTAPRSAPRWPTTSAATRRAGSTDDPGPGRSHPSGGRERSDPARRPDPAAGHLPPGHRPDPDGPRAAADDARPLIRRRTPMVAGCRGDFSTHPLHRRQWRDQRLQCAVGGGPGSPGDRDEPRPEQLPRPARGGRDAGRRRHRRRCGRRRHRRSGVRHRGPVPRVPPRSRRLRHRPVLRPGRSVRVHQLGVGVPEAADPAAGDGVDPAAQPVLAVLPGQDRRRGPAGRRLP